MDFANIPAENVWIAFGLTLFAGLATGIGSALAFFTRRTNFRFLALSLGFSAGVMLYVSFVEILFKAKEALVAELGLRAGSWATAGSFFLGIGIIALIDRLVPNAENPHEMARIEDIYDKNGEIIVVPEEVKKSRKLLRMGLFSALAIAIHNFPEGLATFAAGLKDPTLGLPIAVAIAIHNIPEGIAVSVPVYYATGDRKKAFIYSFLSGLSEPVGAVVGYFLLRSFFSNTLFGTLFGAVAGIMVFISLDELLPCAEEYGEHHLAIYGLVAGMAVMAVSLLLFI